MANVYQDGLVAAEIINEIYTAFVGGFTGYQRFLRAYGVPGFVNTISTLNTSAGCAIVSVNNLHRIYLAGVSGPTMGETVARGYLLSRQVVQNPDVNEAFLVDAITIFNRLEPFTFGGDHQFELYGHSAGGAIAELLAKALSRVPSFSVSRIMTMGAPKPSAAHRILEGPDVERLRLMIFGDPVPFLPTSALDGVSSIALGFLRTAQVARFEEPNHLWDFRHGSGGLVALNRQLIDSVDALPTAAAAERLNSWIAGTGPETRLHSIGQYIHTLRLLLNGSELPIEGAIRERHGAMDRQVNLVLPIQLRAPGSANIVGPRIVMRDDVPATPNDRPLVGILTDGKVTIPGVGSFSVETTRGISNMMIRYIPPYLKAKVQKVGTKWVVIWYDALIYQNDRASPCKTMAKSLNRFLRTMQATGTLFRDPLLTAMTGFMLAAADPANGTRPPLVVG